MDVDERGAMLELQNQLPLEQTKAASQSVWAPTPPRVSIDTCLAVKVVSYHETGRWTDSHTFYMIEFTFTRENVKVGRLHTAARSSHGRWRSFPYPSE